MDESKFHLNKIDMNESSGPVRHLILFVIEALRPDHLSLFGYARPTTPFLEKFSERATVFSQCISPAVRTWQAFTSILTGLYPQRHGVRFIGDKPLASEIPTLGSILHTAGWHGWADTDDLHNAGLARGFDYFDNQPVGKTARWRQRLARGSQRAPTRSFFEHDQKRTADTLAWIQKHPDTPTFALLRYFTTHWPYQPPQNFVELYEACQGRAHVFNDFNDRRYFLMGQASSPLDYAHAVTHYDAAIRFVDGELERLVTGLTEQHVLDETLLVVMGDHGEGLGDHGIWFDHGDELYDEAVRVPLLLFGPDIPRGKAIDTQVQSIDILPTVLEHVGLSVPDKLDGTSLSGLMQHGAGGRAYTFAESERDYHNVPWRYMSGTEGYLRMARTREWKLIYTPRHLEHKFELYNLTDDPRERHDCFATQPETAQTLLQALRAWMEGKAPETSSAEENELDAQVVERLKALGYID